MIANLTFEVYGTDIDKNTGDKIKIKTVYFVEEEIEDGPMTQIPYQLYNLETDTPIFSQAEEHYYSDFQKVIGEGVKTISVENAIEYFEDVFSEADKVVIYAMEMTENTQQFVDDFLNKYNKEEFRIIRPTNITLQMMPNNLYPDIEKVKVRAFISGVTRDIAINDVKNKILDQLPFSDTMLPDNIDLDLSNRVFSLVPINYKVIFPTGTYARFSALSVNQLEKKLLQHSKKHVSVVRLVRRGLHRYHAYVVYKRSKGDKIQRYPELKVSRETSPLTPVNARGNPKKQTKSRVIKKGNKSKKRR
jgi:hypothetical protein